MAILRSAIVKLAMQVTDYVRGAKAAEAHTHSLRASIHGLNSTAKTLSHGLLGTAFLHVARQALELGENIKKTKTEFEGFKGVLSDSDANALGFLRTIPVVGRLFDATGEAGKKANEETEKHIALVKKLRDIQAGFVTRSPVAKLRAELIAKKAELDEIIQSPFSTDSDKAEATRAKLQAEEVYGRRIYNERAKEAAERTLAWHKALVSVEIELLKIQRIAKDTFLARAFGFDNETAQLNIDRHNREKKRQEREHLLDLARGIVSTSSVPRQIAVGHEAGSLESVMAALRSTAGLEDTTKTLAEILEEEKRQTAAAEKLVNEYQANRPVQEHL